MAKATLTDRKVRQILNAGSMPNFALLNHNTTSFESDYGRAMDWIHHSVEQEDLRGELETHLRNTNRVADVSLVKHINGVDIKLLGTISYCLNRGALLAPKSVLRITHALEEARGKEQDVAVAADFEDIAETAAGRTMEAYKSCYSRLDNLRVLVCKGKVELKAVHDETIKILEAHGGLKKAVRKQLVDHYTQSVDEAKQDKMIKDWVKPLQAILKAVNGNTKIAEPKKAAVKVDAVNKAAPNKAAPKATKAPKVASKGKKVVASKPQKNNTKGTRVVTIKPKRDAGVPSVASQVRDLIKANQNSTDAGGMVEIVVRELGLTVQRGKSVVKAFWDKVEA
jgi:hypothetical protein